MAEAKVIEVVGGIIRRGDMYLLGRRPLGKSQGGKWEFIGGKIESGETPEQALTRECMEEIALPIINTTRSIWCRLGSSFRATSGSRRCRSSRRSVRAPLES